MEEPFDGRRTLMTPTATDRPDDLIKLPVFVFYELLRLLADGLCHTHSSSDGVHRMVTADQHRVAAMLVFQPGDLRAAAVPLDLNLVLRDIPWPRVNLAVFAINGRLSNAFAANGSRMPAPAIPPVDAHRLRKAAELAEIRPIRRDLPADNGRISLRMRLSPFSTILVWVTPISTRPPADPHWVEAAKVHGNVVLRWTPSRDPDFYSYEVLRSDAAQPIAPMPLRGACWVDTALPRSVPLTYAVRAVSASGLRSALILGPVLSL
jgi:hypothetical protein